MAEEKKSKGFAVPILRRKSDGQNAVDFVDVKTGEVVDPEGYDLVDQYTASLIQMGLDPEVSSGSSSSSKDKDKAGNGGDGKGSEKKLPRGEYSTMSPGKNAKRDMVNNFGYVNKPGFLGLVKNIPGMPGLAARAVDVGLNINNKVAVDEARKSLGLPTGGGFIRGALKDNQGYIGDVSYNGVTSPVGFEASDALGRTTLTPNEARMRQQLSQNFREADPVEKTQSIGQFQRENPQAAPSFAKQLATSAAQGAVGGALSGNIVGGIVGALTNSVKSKVANVAVDKIGGAVDPEGRVPGSVKDVARGTIAGLLGGDPIGGAISAARSVIGDSIGRALDRREEERNAQANRANMGLGSLSPSFNPGINYTHEDTRGPVTTGLTERTRDVLDSLASSVGTGLTVTSAYRSPSVNSSVGGAKASLHKTGQAFDLSTRGLTNQQKRDLVERAVMSGAMEIGTYPDQSLHIASVQRMAPVMNVDGVDVAQPTGGVTAMHNRTRNDYLNSPSWYRDGLEVSRLAAVPTPRPDEDTPLGIRNEAVANVDLNRISQFTPAAKLAMAQTLAGEIDPRYTDLSTPEGIREANAVLSTMENRANKYGSIENAISAPNQYSTWNNAAAANTAMTNYNNNSSLFNSIVDNYSTDPTSNLGFTSYYNPSISNPGWGASMVNTETIGPHRFGTVSTYSSFGTNFGQTQMSENTRKSFDTSRPASGLGTMASASGTVGFTSSPTSSSNLGGLSSSVSGENANRSNNSSSTSSTSSSGGAYDRGGKDAGLGGTSATKSSSGGSYSSGASSSSKSANSSYSSKDSGLGGTSATKSSTSSSTKAANSSYNSSKDSGLGGTSATKSGASSPGKSSAPGSR